MLNLETTYPDHISRIDEDRRIEINFDLKAPATRFYVCTFEPGKAEHRRGCWTLRDAVDLAGKELDRIRVRAVASESAAPTPALMAGAALRDGVHRPSVDRRRVRRKERPDPLPPRRNPPAFGPCCLASLGGPRQPRPGVSRPLGRAVRRGALAGLRASGAGSSGV